MRRLLLAVAAAASLAACSPSSSPYAGPPPPVACDDLHPCAEGTYCQASVCVPPTQLLCVQGFLDCPTGYVCGVTSACTVAPPPPPPLVVSIVAPSAPVTTKGTVHFAVSVTGGTASAVYLQDEIWNLGTVSGGIFDWNTTSASEGPHSVVALADRGFETFRSAPVIVTVDRTGPRIASSAPVNGAGDVVATDPVQLVMSEPIDPATFVPSAVTVTSTAGPISSAATLAPDHVTVNVALLTLPATRPLTVTVNVGVIGADLVGNAATPASVAFTYPAWYPFGGKLNVDPRGYVADVKVDGSSRPVVAVVDFPSAASTTPNLRVLRFEGGAWAELGAQVNAAGTYAGAVGISVDGVASLAIDQDGRPVVAYVENTSSVRVKRWNGTAWVALGAAHSDGNATGADVAIATGGPIPAGEPVVFFTAYVAPSAVPQAFVKRWDSLTSAWVAMGGALNDDVSRPAWAPSIAIDPSGRPVVAFDEWLTTAPVFTVHARRWESGAWTALGGNLSPDPAWGVKSPDVAFDAVGAPLVAVGYNDHGTSRSYVRRWDGGAWATQVGAVNPMATSGYPDLSLVVDAAGRELVAYGAIVNGTLGASDGIVVTALDGGAWGEIAPTPLGFAMKPEPSTVKLALDPASKLAVVAWCEKPVGTAFGTYDNRCYVRRQIP
jgi:hypothetical protein